MILDARFPIRRSALELVLGKPLVGAHLQSNAAGQEVGVRLKRCVPAIHDRFCLFFNMIDQERCVLGDGFKRKPKLED